MTDIHEQVLSLEAAGIVYDAARLRKPETDLFNREYWRSRNALREVTGGRSSIAFIDSEDGHWALRHYRRGGLMAQFAEDRYWWNGADRTRSFREWRLLAQLKRRDLPVPAPIAACYIRHRLRYSADLITEAIENAATLTQALQAAALSEGEWQRIGETIARFHLQGVHHADLNANNILLQHSTGSVYLLDFDRGRIEPRGSWERSVLARLHRSLTKLRSQNPTFRFSEREWRWLMEGHGSAVTSHG